MPQSPKTMDPFLHLHPTSTSTFLIQHFHSPPPPPPPTTITTTTMGKDDVEKGTTTTTTSKYDLQKGFDLRKCCIMFLIYFLIITITPFLLLLLINLFTIEKPKPPIFHLQSFTLNSLDLPSSNKTIKTRFSAQLETINPNDYVGFLYEADNNVSVLYNHVVIASGQLPEFEQGAENSTVVEISLEGTSPAGPGSLPEDVRRGKDDDGIPLVVDAEVPIKALIGRKGVGFTAYATCHLVVDGLEGGKTTMVMKDECNTYVRANAGIF